jgi:hypothetical protein
MKVYPVIKITPYLCECEHQCLCGENYRTVHKVFSSLAKAKNYVDSLPRPSWKGDDYYEVMRIGFTLE